jgi:DNA-binding response OmpR family regulator
MPDRNVTSRPVRVLVAEDDQVTALLLSKLLRSLGYEPVVAHDGQEAVRAYLRDPPVQIVLLDWMMPGMDGPEVCRRIRRSTTRPPSYIIMVTSRQEQTSVVEGLEAGADAYLIKPIDSTALAARVSMGVEVLRQRSSTAGR